MKKFSPKFINQSVALLVIVFVIWTGKGGFKDQIMSTYKKGVNTSSDSHQKVNHFADFLYQYATYIALSTILFYISKVLSKVLDYTQKLSATLSKYQIVTKILQKSNRINWTAIFAYFIFIAANSYYSYMEYKQSKNILQTVSGMFIRLFIFYIVSPFLDKAASTFTTTSQTITLYLNQIQQLIMFTGIYIYLLSQPSIKLKNHQILLFPSWIILTFWLKFFSEAAKNKEHISLFLQNLSFYLRLFTFAIMILQNSGENVFRYI